MREIAVYEAKTRLSELLLEVERGEQVTITRRGQPAGSKLKCNTVNEINDLSRWDESIQA